MRLLAAAVFLLFLQYQSLSATELPLAEPESVTSSNIIAKEADKNQYEYNDEVIKKTIDDASAVAKENAKNAEKSLKEAEKSASKSSSASLVKLSEERAKIERSRSDVAKLQLSLASDLKKTNDDLDKISEHLVSLESRAKKRSLTKAELINIYEDIVINWRNLVDNSLKVFARKGEVDLLPAFNPNSFNFTIPADITDKKIIAQYENSYRLLQGEYDNIVKLRTLLNNANKNYQSKLLLQSGKLRANLLQRILAIDPEFITFNDGYIDDLIREIKLIPFRPIAIFYSKILRYHQIIDTGFSGYIYILKQMALLGVVVLILLVSKSSIIKLTDIFNLWGKFCIDKAANSIGYSNLARAYAKITPYFKWLILLAIFALANVILQNSVLAELSVFIPYFQYYFLYKIFRIFVHLNLHNFLYKTFVEPTTVRAINTKIRQTTKLLGVYLLSSVYVLYMTESIVRKAYFYNLTLTLFIFGLVFVLAVIAHKWKREILIVAQNNLSKKLYILIAPLLSDDRKSMIFSLLVLGLLFAQLLMRKFIILLNDYDFFKNILSHIYRKKLESAAKKNTVAEESKICGSYIELFSQIDKSETFIPVEESAYEEVQNIIDNWKAEKSEESSIIIHGEKGIGKSTLLAKIAADNADLEVRRLSFKQKITSKTDFINLITELFQFDLEDISLFKQLYNHEEKTIIILDDCHNLFLAKEDGFGALNELFNLLVKINNPNLLWISSFNSYSWNYLQSAIKIGNYYRYIFRLSRWSDEEVMNLIMQRHNKTGFELTFDPLIFALDANKLSRDFDGLQLKFFQMIWGQSKGNPTIAICLWLSSLHQEGYKNIKISLPKLARPGQLSSLSDDHLFVYGAIVKHQNLSVAEIANILSISKEESLNIVRIGIEKGYLVESILSRRRFIVAPEWQIAISQLLVSRNFVYSR